MNQIPFFQLSFVRSLKKLLRSIIVTLATVLQILIKTRLRQSRVRSFVPIVGTELCKFTRAEFIDGEVCVRVCTCARERGTFTSRVCSSHARVYGRVQRRRRRRRVHTRSSSPRGATASSFPAGGKRFSRNFYVIAVSIVRGRLAAIAAD